VGVLVDEVDTFVLAILFSSPLNCKVFYMKVAMEISLHKVLGDINTRMYNSQPASIDEGTMFHWVKRGACQEAAMVSADNVWVTATMSSATKSVMKFTMANQDSSSSESKDGITH